MEQECLAVVLGIKAFETYLLGKPFVIQTDHRALQWLQQFKHKNGRLTRWSLALQPYTFTVTHRKGRENTNVNALSRIPQNPCFALQKEARNVTEREVQSRKQADHLGGSNQSQPIKLKTMEFQSGPATLSDPYQEHK